MTATTWERRDLPVLQAVATTDDENVRNGFLMLDYGRTGTFGLDLVDEEIHSAILVLGDAGYVEGNGPTYNSGGGVHFTSFSVTGRGQQALGQWPLFHNITSAETLARLLETLAAEAPTEEESANMRRAARYARTVGAGALRAAAIGATSQVVRNMLGLP
jgi:hypothetical protein